mmetsp:Transcript_1720/g.4525  ORF Transcript_1720/g.4525 Transcript_1720/m.4525 type:complete len:200 (-) Transcript_1720:729-1328(-)
MISHAVVCYTSVECYIHCLQVDDGHRRSLRRRRRLRAARPRGRARLVHWPQRRRVGRVGSRVEALARERLALAQLAPRSARAGRVGPCRPSDVAGAAVHGSARLGVEAGMLLGDEDGLERLALAQILLLPAHVQHLPEVALDGARGALEPLHRDGVGDRAALADQDVDPVRVAQHSRVRRVGQHVGQHVARAVRVAVAV